MVVPIYLAEASPTSIRGRIVTFNVVFITSGYFLYNFVNTIIFRQLIAYLIVLACGENWRLMLGISGVPAIIQLLCMLFFPESPKWLLKMGKDQQAKEVFSRVFNTNIREGKEEMDGEIDGIKEALALEDDNAPQYLKYKELFTVYRKIVFIGMSLQILQQLSGINTAMYYGPDIMTEAGFGDKNDPTSVYILL